MAHRRILYVGGLADETNQDTVKAAFIPFGDIVEVNMPFDNLTGKHRGFAFIEFEDVSDAADAIENMHGAEIFGKTITVNVARPSAVANRAVWDTSIPTDSTEVDAALREMEQAKQQEQSTGETEDQPAKRAKA